MGVHRPLGRGQALGESARVSWLPPMVLASVVASSTTFLARCWDLCFLHTLPNPEPKQWRLAASGRPGRALEELQLHEAMDPGRQTPDEGRHVCVLEAGSGAPVPGGCAGHGGARRVSQRLEIACTQAVVLQALQQAERRQHVRFGRCLLARADISCTCSVVTTLRPARLLVSSLDRAAARHCSGCCSVKKGCSAGEACSAGSACSASLSASLLASELSSEADSAVAVGAALRLGRPAVGSSAVAGCSASLRSLAGLPCADRPGLSRAAACCWRLVSTMPDLWAFAAGCPEPSSLFNAGLLAGLPL